MRKSILRLTACIFVIGATLISCNTSSEKVDNAEKNVLKAHENLNKANQEYLADVENYRKETADKIAANDKSIAEFKARIADEKIDAQIAYQKKIIALEQKNSDLKKRIDGYKAESKEQWELFKAEFSKDMDELGTAFVNFFSTK
ncbi:MAG: peptidase M23 [Flavobacteriaceae bacterium]|nr:peptidase M23 [Flavobacteriaceae bacterium]